MMPTVAPTVSMNAHGAHSKVLEGNKTASIYGLIRDGKFNEVIKVLTQELQQSPRSRAALSLLAYVYYQSQDFEAAARMYESLIKLCPESQEYKFCYAQSLYKASLYAEAAKAAVQVDDPQYSQRILHLQAAIKYEQDDVAGTKVFINKCLKDDPDTITAQACILFKEGEFEKARIKFQEVVNLVGAQSFNQYNIALCHYKMGQYGPALKALFEIIDHGVRDHPELCVGSNSDVKTNALEVQSVGNTQILKETALIEAFNLRSAIEYQSGKAELAREVLRDMPPRSESELDPVTLHNMALMNMDNDPSGGFQKLTFLLSQPPFPPETFGNLLLLYAKYQYFDLAADVMADYSQLQESCLSEDLNEFLKATIASQSSPEEAYRRFEALGKKHVDTIRKISKQIQDAQLNKDHEQAKIAYKENEEARERYMPVLMAQAKIYWDMENYGMVEKILMQAAEICMEHPVWRLNLAHVYFMQDKFQDAVRYYEPVVRAKIDDILSITAIVLANLCVSYIMISQNEDAEDLMKQIEKAEEFMSAQDPTKQYYHLCIVNLVIGTLYCSKGHFEFGVARIIKSLEPLHKKLGPDTWYYTKRCLLAVAENVSKQMLVVKDKDGNSGAGGNGEDGANSKLYPLILNFLDQAERHGKGIKTVIQEQRGQEVDMAVHNVGHEARLLKKLFLRLRE